VRHWFGRALPDKRQAQQEALAACRSTRPGMLCEVALTVCTDGTH
jgi:hypothetical protein